MGARATTDGSHRYPKAGQSVQIVDGAVDGIEHPRDARAAVGIGTLLAKHAVEGPQVRDAFAQQPLCGKVHLGHDVDGG